MSRTLLLLALAFSLAGCGTKDTTTVTAPDGSKVETSKDGSSMTVTTPDGGTASVGTGTVVTEADLGVPLYPGSQPVDGQDMKVETPTEKSMLSTRSTSDDPKKVQEFYQSQVKDLKFTTMEAAGDVTVMGNVERADGSRIVVTAVRKSGENVTTVTVGCGKETKK
jgi:predicted small lipoprotein YifL